MNVRRAVSNLGDGPFGRQAESAQDREILSQAAFHRVISIERTKNGAIAQAVPAHAAGHGQPPVVGNQRQERQ